MLPFIMEESKFHITRRQAIAAAGTTGGVVGISGCSDILGRDPITMDRRYTPEPEELEEIDDEIELEGDERQWTTYTLVEGDTIEYEIDLIEGEDFNFYVIEEDEFEAFEDEEDFDAIEDTIEIEITYIESSVTVDEDGDYRFIIDNAGIEPDNA